MNGKRVLRNKFRHKNKINLTISLETGSKETVFLTYEDVTPIETHYRMKAQYICAMCVTAESVRVKKKTGKWCDIFEIRP